MIYIFVFLSLFDPQIPYAPNGVGFSLIILLTLLPLAIKSLSNEMPLFIIKQAKPFILIFFMSLIITLIRIIISEGIGIEYTMSWIKAFIVFLSVILVFIVFFKRDKPFRIINAIIISFLLNSLINFIAGSFPHYFEFLNMLRTPTITSNLSTNPYRNSFISGSGYFSIGTAYGLFCIFYAYLLSKNSSFLGILAFCIITMASIMAARTSILAILLAILIIFHGAKKNIIYASIPILLIPFFDSHISHYYSWIQSFFNFQNDPSGKIVMNDMHFWPGLKIFILGQGEVNNGLFTYTDSGYMKDILFGGVLFMLLKISFVFIFFLKTYQKHFIFSLFFCTSIVLFQVKGAFMYNNAQGMAVFYFVYFILTTNKKLGYLK